jgi:multiple sugar transport system permease protein/raffinose/stachyose/melibiose transport system permease protein
MSSQPSALPIRRRHVASAKTVRLASVWIILLVLIGLTLSPLYLMLVTSLKSNDEFYQNLLGVSTPFYPGNYGLAWQEISPYILNSAIVTGLSMVGVLVLAALAAYAFARLAFPGKNVLYYFVIALMMVPGVLTLIPSFVLVRSFNLLDTRWALILPYISGGVVFATFVLRSFFAGLPEELFEAMRIDGASELQIFWYLGVPLVRPALATVAILQILGTWNDYLWPLVTLYTDRNFTLTIGLVAFLGRHLTEWGPLMAGYTLAAAPLVLLFAVSTRTFIAGMTQGGLKL